MTELGIRQSFLEKLIGKTITLPSPDSDAPSDARL
jgi:hypothetical protein